MKIMLNFPGAGCSIPVEMNAVPGQGEILSFEDALRADSLFGPFVHRKWRVKAVEHRLAKEHGTRGQPVVGRFAILTLEATPGQH